MTMHAIIYCCIKLIMAKNAKEIAMHAQNDIATLYQEVTVQTFDLFYIL